MIDQNLNLQDLETLFSKSHCNCHFINPHKTRILSWKQVKDGQTTFFLRIGIQKFISQEQTDRNGEIYWRYWNLEAKEEPTSESDSITKFNQRQEKAENYASNVNSNSN